MNKVTNFEDNLKLHQESKRKILDIMLSSSMPHQVQNIKTILWMNLLFIGLSSQIFKNIEFNYIHVAFYGFISLSILLMLIALLKNRYKWYGGFDDINYAHDIYDNKFSKSDMIGTLLKNDDIAITKNSEIMKNTAWYMNLSLKSTLVSFVLFLLILISSVSLSQIKGGDEIMAEEKPAKPSEQPVNTTGSDAQSQERTLKDIKSQTSK